VAGIVEIATESPLSQSASALNKTQTDHRSVALITVVPSEGDRLLEWISTLLA